MLQNMLYLAMCFLALLPSTLGAVIEVTAGGEQADPTYLFSDEGGNGLANLTANSDGAITASGDLKTGTGTRVNDLATRLAAAEATIAGLTASLATLLHYTYFRWNVPESSQSPHGCCFRLASLNLYDQFGNLVSTPVTDCGSPPCATASSYFAGTEPRLAFDGDSATDWAPNARYGWLQYQFTSAMGVRRIVLTFLNANALQTTSGPTELWGSNDGTTWTTLVTIQNTNAQSYDVSF
jgi:hypothetical protein